MALVFPRQMPLISKRRTISFEQERVDSYSPENGGRIGAVQVGWPRWVGVWEYRNLNRGEREEVRAWVSGQRGPMRLFFGRDGRFIKPRSGDPVSTVSAWSVDTTGTVLTLTTDRPVARFWYGDYVGFTWGEDNQRFLVRVIEPAVANTSGVVTVTVEPPLPTWLPDDATAVIVRPDCLMRMDPNRSTTMPEFERDRFMTIKITGVQEIIE